MSEILLNPSKHISFTSEKDIDDICKPLKQMCGIDFFIYQRNFIDPETKKIQFSAFLCNNAKILEFSWFYPKEQREAAQYNLQSPSNYQLFSVSQPKFSAILANQFQLNNILGKDERVSETEWDYFAFGSTEKNIDTVGLYLNNIDILNKFIIHFKNRANKLISAACENKLRSGRNISTLDDPFVNSRSQFLSSLETKHYYLTKNNGTQVSVPAAEMKCLSLLYQGRTIKEIARILELAPRTVETNLSRSKLRLNCMGKSNLLDILSTNVSSIITF